MWLCLLLVAVTSSVTSGEKLGDIEVITRDELGLVPPTRDAPQEADTLTQTKTSFVSSDDVKPEHKFIPLPALSYLPPAKTPLPIESTEAPQVTSAVILQDDYLPPPRALPDEIQPVLVDTPDILYTAPQSDEIHVQHEVEATLNTQAHSEGHVYPIGVEEGIVESSVPIGPVPVVGYEPHYVNDEKHAYDKPDFFSGIRDSKLALLGGIVGAKSAVFEGLRNVKESVISGVRDALAAKAAAFSSLKHTGGGSSYGTNVGYGEGSYGTNVGIGDGNYGEVPEGGYGTNPGVGVADVGAGNEFPLAPVPIPVPIPVHPYPVYPIYPPYAEPIYPSPAPLRPIYRPKPFEAKKAAFSGAIARALAKLKAPFQHSHSYGYRRW